jgi:hypothetical protein
VPRFSIVPRNIGSQLPTHSIHKHDAGTYTGKVLMDFNPLIVYLKRIRGRTPFKNIKLER